MNEPHAKRFERAFTSWHASPVEASNASSSLSDVSLSLLRTQSDVRAALTAFHDHGGVVPPPIEGRWYDGISYNLGRSIRTLRRMQQTGRHQIATRTLLAQAETLKQVWDAYRGAANV